MTQFTLYEGDVAWTVTIDRDKTGYIISAVHGAERCFLQVKLSTVNQFVRERSGTDPVTVLFDHLQLRTAVDGVMTLHLRTQLSSKNIAPNVRQMSLQRIEDPEQFRKSISTDNLPALSPESKQGSRRNFIQKSNSTRQLPPLESPPKTSINENKSASAATSWSILKKIMRRMPVFDIEEALLQNPHDIKLRIDLGLRYSEETVTQIPAMIILEQASFFSDHSSAGWQFWGALGDIHYKLLERYPRHHRSYVFHLDKCTDAFSKALSFIENAADSNLIVKYATSMFIKGERELPYELLKTLSLTYASSGMKLNPMEVTQRLFLLFRITLANGLMTGAIGYMTKLIGLAVDVTYLPRGYTLNDCHLMLARCCQIEGDFLFATNTFARVLSERFGPASIYSDEQYLSLWQTLADISFQQGHMWLCIEYYSLALTYAKQLNIRAAIYYRRGLSHYCLSEPMKAEDDYRRAKSASHDVKPEVSMHELHKAYKEEFDKLMETTIADLIAQVRRGMGKTSASIRVQRHFRQFLHRKRRRQETSRMLLQFPTQKALVQKSNLGIPEQEETKPMPSPPRILTPDEQFETKRAAALESLQALHMSCLQFPSSNKKQLTHQQQSISFLAPDFDRPDYRRQRSIVSFRRLGYSTGDVSCILHWKAVLQCGLSLYRSRGDLRRAIAEVKSFHVGMPQDVAFCALADSDGQVDEACGKLSNPKYRSELDYVCCVLDVMEWMARPEDEPLPGVPEIDPDTGKFYIHEVHGMVKRADGVLPRNLPTKVKEEMDILVRMKKGRKKEKSFRVGQVIATHSAKEWLLNDPPLLTE